MKVLHLFSEIKFSGAEIMYRNAARYFQDNGVDLFAWATGISVGEFAQAFEEQGIIVQHHPLPQRKSLYSTWKYYRHLYSYLREGNFDILHIHRQDLFVAAIVARLAGVRCVKTQHNVFRNRWFTRPYAILRRFVVRKVFSLVFHSIGPSVYANELEYYKNPSVQINNWYDSLRFYPATSLTEKQELRAQLEIPNNAFVVISVGGCSDIKKHSDILRAFASVGEGLDFNYLHLGTGSLEREEQALASELGISEKVRFVGNTDKVREYLVAADVFAMPSKFEGLGNAALEAMACGVPPVLYDVPGLRDLVVDRDNGYLIRPDWQQLAKTFQRCHANPEEREGLGTKAAEHVENHYSMSKNVMAMIDLYLAPSAL
jgi:glycosyltransferase involved in cell wall biosynthesis